MSTSAVPAQPAVVGMPPSSLYVGDLHPNVTEAMLFEKFSTVAMPLTVRVCRDAVTRASLGYAYVNFQHRADAESALEKLNFEYMVDRSIRIMWSQRDPSIRRSGAGNIFIKNLSKHIDTKAIYDTFSMFGNILSCKVATDLDGKSKGYGFIHFETEESALKAIEKVNGMLLEGKTVYVAKFVPRAARLREFGENGLRFNIVYIKNFGDKLDNDGLEKLFSKFGKITSCVVMVDDEGKSRGFGFCCYEDPDDAAKAVEEMNNYELPDTDMKLTVCRAQKKSERQAELKRLREQRKIETMQRYQGVNLYVKNIDDTISEEVLKKIFEGFGPITSTKIMCDENGISKGFGFVCFEKPEDATKAVVEMSNKMVGSKPLYVALAQRKEDRRAQLASQYMQRLTSMRMQNPTGLPSNVYAPSGGGYFVSTLQQNQRQPNYMPMTAGTYNNPRPYRWQGAMPTNFNQQQQFRARNQNGGRRMSQAGGQLHRPSQGQQMRGVPYNSVQYAQPSAVDSSERTYLDDLTLRLMNIRGMAADERVQVDAKLRESSKDDILEMLRDDTILKNKVEDALATLRVPRPNEPL